jgi:hypothetical protein
MRFFGFLFLLVCVAAPVSAQENELWETTKTIVDVLDPVVDYGVFFNSVDIGQAEGFLGLSGALYKYKKDDLELGSVRVGVAFEQNHKVYTVAQANVINLTKTYAPQQIKDIFSPGDMDRFWDLVEQYTKVGIGPGFDIEAEQIGVVATIGGRINF